MLRIAIDGTASAGKGSIAKEVARRLNIAYIDTGAMYRAIAWKVQEMGIQVHDLNQNPTESLRLESLLKEVNFDFQWIEKQLHIFLNHQDISSEIRTESVGQMASVVSTIPMVRDYLSKIQRAYVCSSSLVMDGRDIGTVIIPDAELKVFVDADIEIRAQRRHQEMLAKGQTLNLQDVLSDLQQRDDRDRNRTVAPLKRAADAKLLDTSHIDIENGVQQILQWVEQRFG